MKIYLMNLLTSFPNYSKTSCSYSKQSMLLKHREKINIFRDPLFKLANILGIVPCYNHEKEKVTHQRLFKLYAVLLSALMLWATIICTSKLYDGIASESLLLAGLEFLVIASSMFLFLVEVLGSSFGNVKSWSRMLSLLSYEDYHTRTTSYNIPLILLFSGFLFTFTLFLFVLNYMGIYYAEHFIIFYLPRHVTICLIYNIITLLRKRYKIIYDTFVEINRCTVIKSSTVKNLQDVKRIYIEADEIVKSINAVFGWSLLLLLSQSIASVLLFLGLLTDSSLKLTMRNFISREAIISNLLYTLITACGPIMIVFACDAAAQDGNKLLKKCCKLRDNLPLIVSEKEELDVLVNLFLNKSPKFTAANFFEIKRSTLLSLISTTTTYMIVILQTNYM